MASYIVAVWENANSLHPFRSALIDIPRSDRGHLEQPHSLCLVEFCRTLFEEFDRQHFNYATNLHHKKAFRYAYILWVAGHNLSPLASPHMHNWQQGRINEVWSPRSLADCVDSINHLVCRRHPSTTFPGGFRNDTVACLSQAKCKSLRRTSII